MGDGYCAHGPQFSLKDGRWMQRLERLSRGAEQRNPLADRRESLKRCTVEQDSSDLQGTKFLCCVLYPSSAGGYLDWSTKDGYEGHY